MYLVKQIIRSNNKLMVCNNHDERLLHIFVNVYCRCNKLYILYVSYENFRNSVEITR